MPPPQLPAPLLQLALRNGSRAPAGPPVTAADLSAADGKCGLWPDARHGLYAPLVARDHLVALVALERADGPGFEQRDADVLGGLAEPLAPALDHGRRCPPPPPARPRGGARPPRPRSPRPFRPGPGLRHPRARPPGPPSRTGPPARRAAPACRGSPRRRAGDPAPAAVPGQPDSRPGRPAGRRAPPLRRTHRDR